MAIAYAKEGADVAVVYLEEHSDAKETKQRVEKEGRHCLLIAGDICDEGFCQDAVGRTVEELGHLDILVNNAGVHYPQESIEDISTEQLERTFRTNILSMFFLTKAALKHLKEGSAIVNTTSVTAYRGSPHLLDYTATKGAIVSFTRSLAKNLVENRSMGAMYILPIPPLPISPSPPQPRCKLSVLQLKGGLRGSLQSECLPACRT